jgi:hypothetical protein
VGDDDTLTFEHQPLRWCRSVVIVRQNHIVTTPSDYELAAWRNIQEFKARAFTRVIGKAGDQAAAGVAEVGKRATKYLENHPKALLAVERGQAGAAKGAKVIGSNARKAAKVIPSGVTDWSGAAFGSAKGMVGRVSRAGLSPKQVVGKHQKHGHDVSSLFDMRNLDLEQIDVVRGRGATWAYPILAAASGAGAGLIISGGELLGVAGAGAAAAPSAGAIAGAMVGDASVVLGLSSRSVGQVSLLYGYDPEDPSEKVFVMSVVNAGTAVSAGAKTAAMADISRLTQALARGATRKVLDRSIIAKVSKQFAKAFEVRFTKASLGKIVPAVGIVIGGAFNWATLESIVDVADVAYRRRFLLEKYPHLADEKVPVPEPDVSDEPKDATDDVVFSVLDEIVEAGGPDLR